MWCDKNTGDPPANLTGPCCSLSYLPFIKCKTAFKIDLHAIPTVLNELEGIWDMIKLVAHLYWSDSNENVRIFQ
jgi:hypothetical protein